jgi:aspartate-semialdehyde dehydrogenase
MSDKAVAVVGATGSVGQTMVSILEERDYPLGSLRLLASERSAGSVVETKWGSIEVEDLSTADPTGVDVALFSAGGERSRAHAGSFVAAGAVVIDNSSAFRMDANVPLVVVQVNDAAAEHHEGIIANPNCTTMTLMMAAGPLHRAAGLRSVVASSYQAVSGSGRQGVEELVHQVDALRPGLETLIRGGWADPEPTLYPRPIGFNVIPFAGSEVEGGYTEEEMKLVNESRKILEIDDLLMEPTCVRVPVMVGHGVSTTLRFERPVGVEEAVEVLNDAHGIEVWSDQVPTPLDSAGLDAVLVGRIRATLGEPGGINLWVVGDNLRKGAALNAVQIAELLV